MVVTVTESWPSTIKIWQHVPENNISSVLFFFSRGLVLFFGSCCISFHRLQFCVSSSYCGASDSCTGPPVDPKLKESVGILGSLISALWSLGWRPEPLEPHLRSAFERAWISLRIKVIFQDFWLTSRRVGSRSRPSVFYFGSVVLRKGQGRDEKVFKANTSVVPPEFSKSVSDLWSTADGCELFMSGFWADF